MSFQFKKIALGLITTLSIVAISGCSHFKSRPYSGKGATANKDSRDAKDPVKKDSESANIGAPDSQVQMPGGQDSSQAAPPLQTLEEAPVPAPSAAPQSSKVGIILGPGAIKAFAHIGVLQEAQRNRLPVAAIIGIEMGALPAALYANKSQAFDVEWQMFKIKKELLVPSKNLLGLEGANSTDGLESALKEIFSTGKVEASAIPFACPSFNLEKRQNFWMAKGAYYQMLPYCVAQKPLFKPHLHSIANIWDLDAAKSFLKAKGAKKILYVDVLGAKAGNPHFRNIDDSDNILWSIHTDMLSRAKFDFVISVPTSDLGLDDFENRRELLLRGQEAAKKQLSPIMKDIGL
jgi:NTE family protein